MRIYIDGMSCEHCKMRVEKALSGIENVKDVNVDLEGGYADLKTDGVISEEVFREKIDDAGYDFVRIEN